MNKNRYHAIDHLRTSMMFVVMLGHPLLPYVTVPRAFNDPSAHVSFDYAGVFLYAFAMQAFFVTAGFASALIFEKKGTGSLWKNRFTRIFLPLLVAYICISPLMRGAYHFSAGVVEFDSIGAGLSIFLTGEWLRWGKVYHLWFLISLLVFTAISCAGLWMLNVSQLTSKLSSNVARCLKSDNCILILVLIACIGTVPSYILDTGRGTHWSMQITLLGYFILGWLTYHYQTIIDVFKRRWLMSFAVALVTTPLCIWASRARLFDEHNIDVFMGIVAGTTNGIVGMCMTIALIGWFHLHLSKPTRIGDEFSKASYWVYLIHFPIVVAAGGIVSVLDLPSFIKYLLTLMFSLPIIAFSYFVLVLKTPLKRVIVGKTA